jgi:integrase
MAEKAGKQDAQQLGSKPQATERKRRKRGQNEGSIYKRGDGRWVAAVWLGYKGGKPKRKCYYGETRKQVSDELTEALRNVQQGIPVVTERQTLKEFLDRWLSDCVKPRVRPATLASYDQQIKVHIAPALGHFQLARLAPQHIQRYLNDKLNEADAEKRLSARTISYHRTLLRMALGQALKWGLVPRNVAGLVDAPRVERFEIQPIDQAQAQTFLDAIKGERMEALFTVALSLGLRRGEALGLRWQDVDFESRTMRICQQLHRVEKKLVFDEPKTKSSRRLLSLPNSLAAKLREHRTKQLEEKLSAGSEWKENGLVFATSLGTPIDPRNVKRRLDSILEKAKLPHFRIHDLRHFCASLLLAQGVELKVVSQILGHTQISITADIYTHVLPQTQKAAIDLLDQLLTAN